MYYDVESLSEFYGIGEREEVDFAECMAASAEMEKRLDAMLDLSDFVDETAGAGQREESYQFA